MAVHYPRCVVRIQATITKFNVIATSRQSSMTRGGDGEGPVSIDFERSPMGDDLVFQSNRVVDLRIIPRSVTWNNAGNGVAGTCSITFSWRDLPLDPRLLEKAIIEIYCDDVGDPVTDPMSLVDAPLGPRFTGAVDKPDLSFGEDQTITLSCRDLSGQLRSTPWQRGANAPSISTDAPLSVVFENILAQAKAMKYYSDGSPMGGEITSVEAEPDEDYVVSDIIGIGTWAPKANASVWDVLQGLAREIGLEAFVEANKVWIRKSYYGNTQPIREFAFGSNIASCSITRELHAPTIQQVIVSALRLPDRVRVTGEYPPTSSLPANTPAKAFGLVPGNWPQKNLDIMAKSIWGGLNKRILNGSLTTTAMTAFAAEDSESLSVLNISPGSSIVVGIRSGVVGGAALDALSRGEMVQFLMDKVGTDRNQAEAAADIWENANDDLKRFYVDKATHSWSSDSGYSLSLDFYNLIEA